MKKGEAQGLKKFVGMVILLFAIAAVIFIVKNGVDASVAVIKDPLSFFRRSGSSGDPTKVNIIKAYDAQDEGALLNILAYTESLPVGGPNLGSDMVAIELDKLVDCTKLRPTIKVFKKRTRLTSVGIACAPSCGNGDQGDTRIIVSGFQESPFFSSDAEYTIRFEMDPANPPVVSCTGNLAFNPARSVIGFEK